MPPTTNNLRILGVCALISACASTHDMTEGSEGIFGGGYSVEQVSEGVYKIVAKTNVAQWSDYGTARRMWKKHAQEACEGKAYVELDVNEYEYDRFPNRIVMSIEQLFFRYIITVKEGLAVCSNDE